MLTYFKILNTYWNNNITNRLIIIPNLLLFSFRLPFALLENIVFSNTIKSHNLEHDPIFILGYYRSGTTHLQKLMALNTQHEKLNIFKSYFPDSFLLLEKWLKPIMQFFFDLFKIKNPIHRCPFNWDLPGEEDIAFALYPNIISFNWFHAFPSQLERALEKSVNFKTENGKKYFKNKYLWLVKKLSYSFKGKRLVLKSPPNTARIPLLLELFPNAKFVFISRDEQETLLSNRYMWDVVSGASLEKISFDKRDELILETKRIFESKFHKDKSLIPSSNLVEISFSDLMKNPNELIENIHQKLELNYTREYFVILKTYLAKEHGKYRGIYNSK